MTVPPVPRDAIADLPRNKSGLLFESPRGRMWRQSSHHHRWRVVRAMEGRPRMNFYELRHCAAPMLLERGMSPSDVAVQFGHTDGRRLVMGLYGYPSEVAARERLLACWDAPISHPTDVTSGSLLEQDRECPVNRAAAA